MVSASNPGPLCSNSAWIEVEGTDVAITNHVRLFSTTTTVPAARTGTQSYTCALMGHH
jgi:hypothetical protein